MRQIGCTCNDDTSDMNAIHTTNQSASPNYARGQNKTKTKKKKKWSERKECHTIKFERLVRWSKWNTGRWMRMGNRKTINHNAKSFNELIFFFVLLLFQLNRYRLQKVRRIEYTWNVREENANTVFFFVSVLFLFFRMRFCYPKTSNAMQPLQWHNTMKKCCACRSFVLLIVVRDPWQAIIHWFHHKTLHIHNSQNV